ncbi:SDR family NAD(P)-dependent oxidoreductase [Arthrobacter sp. MA-N2]|uniref:SDR family NAD(P)-dependent oxidoreductase n=1 Tax=Arthrobacter sp. MA-N2 TaxID=1101188 RepID=UPI0004B06AAD|nr:SDR family NAD(P)-dependent oxidoreductase [Arthrobacter sp. MA-N2]
MQSNRFAGKNVVVIGTGMGLTGPDDISTASAKAFAKEGADVVLAQFTQEAADACVSEIRSSGGSARGYAHDPRDPAAVFGLAEHVSKEWDRVDVLVTHHFATQMVSVEDLSLETWEETIRVNLTGVFTATKAFLPMLKAADAASIVHAGSIDGNFGNVNIPAYSASKGGVHVLIHVLAAELAPYGIRVNGIGRASSTAMTLPPTILSELANATPLARSGRPEEYADAVLYLASPQSSYVTGVILPVDGGRSALTGGCTPAYQGFARPESPQPALN